MKNCSVCRVQQNRSAFSVSRKSADGLRDECRTCNAHRAKAWRSANPEKAKHSVMSWQNRNRDQVASHAKTWRKQHPTVIEESKRRNWAGVLVSQAKNRAKHSGLEFSLSNVWVHDLFLRQDGKCFWLGVDLVPSGTPYAPWKPSLDRLDNTKGYTEDNVVLSSRFANHARNGMDAEAFRATVAQLRSAFAIVSVVA